MIKTLLSSLFAVFLFAMGAIGAWYFVQFQEKKEQEKIAAEEMVDAEDLNVTGLSSDDPASDLADDGRENPSSTMRTRLPAPVRNKTMSSTEAFQHGILVAEQAKDAKAREERLQEQETQLNLARKDLDQQKLVIEGVLQQVKTYAAQADSLLVKVQQERNELKAEKEQRQKDLEEIKSARSVPTEVEKMNVKKLAGFLGGMDENKAAEILKSLANSGNMNYALMLLDSVEQRDASKLLDAINEPGLRAEIAEGYRNFPREPKPVRR